MKKFLFALSLLFIFVFTLSSCDDSSKDNEVTVDYSEKTEFVTITVSEKGELKWNTITGASYYKVEHYKITNKRFREENVYDIKNISTSEAYEIISLKIAAYKTQLDNSKIIETEVSIIKQNGIFYLKGNEIKYNVKIELDNGVTLDYGNYSYLLNTYDMNEIAAFVGESGYMFSNGFYMDKDYEGVLPVGYMPYWLSEDITLYIKDVAKLNFNIDLKIKRYFSNDISVTQFENVNNDNPITQKMIDDAVAKYNKSVSASKQIEVDYCYVEFGNETALEFPFTGSIIANHRDYPARIWIIVK